MTLTDSTDSIHRSSFQERDFLRAMQAATNMNDRQSSSPLAFSFLDLPYEVREMIYLPALQPIPTRIHLIPGPISLWSLVPNFNPGKAITIPALFTVSKQIHDESTRIFYCHTSVIFRLTELKQPLFQIMDTIPVAVKYNVRNIDLHMCGLCSDSSTIEHLVSLIKEQFLKLQTIHLTIEQETPSRCDSPSSRSGQQFAVSHKTLSGLVKLPLRLTRIRLFVHDVFQRNERTLTSFRTLLGSLSHFTQLEEVEVYFQTIVRGFIMYPTPTFTPEPAPTRAAYLAFERRVLSPYLSSLASALPHVRHFQVWRLRARGEDQKSGTQPIKEKELLDLLGARARVIDSQAGFPVIKRFPDGSAVRNGESIGEKDISS